MRSCDWLLKKRLTSFHVVKRIINALMKPHNLRWTNNNHLFQDIPNLVFYTVNRGEDMEKMIKRAIDYIELNILESIEISDVAFHCYVSQFHLQRLFKALTGVSVSEYIRNRRLSLAGFDVQGTKMSLLDIAMKYQYNSSEGFQKAFYRFHGLNPLKARKEQSVLKTYQPLTICISFKGGISMEYRIVELESMKLLCVKKQFPNSIVESEENTEISDFWTEKLQDGTVGKLLGFSSSKEIYGPCGSIDKASKYFSYGIGVLYEGESIDGFNLWEINHPLYACFVCKTKEDMGNTWKAIMEEFLPNSDYEMVDEPDFELYPTEESKYFCEIYVPIKKSEQ